MTKVLFLTVFLLGYTLNNAQEAMAGQIWYDQMQGRYEVCINAARDLGNRLDNLQMRFNASVTVLDKMQEMAKQAGQKPAAISKKRKMTLYKTNKKVIDAVKAEIKMFQRTCNGTLKALKKNQLVIGVK